MHLYELPDACITSVISMTTPKDACRMAAVASWCGALASSDQVWEKFFPSNYLDILKRSPDGQKLLEASVSKKDLYLRMCDNPLLIDEETKSFALDKVSGKKIFMLSAKTLAIVWSHTPAYWRFIPLTKSRFKSVALLIMVCWLEIQGVINSKMLSPNPKYAAYMIFTVKEASYGFSNPAEEVSMGFSGQECEKHLVLLGPVGAGEASHPDAVTDGMGASTAHIRISERRSDGWLEIEIGEIFINGDEDDDVQMRLTEIKGLNWKSGLVVEGIEIRPKHQ